MARRRRAAVAVRTVVTPVVRRRRNRVRRRTRVLETVTSKALVPVAPPMQRIMPNRMLRQSRVGMSKAGMAFLKCAFASPDFDVDPGQGVPDRFHGKTVAIKDCYTTSLNFTPGQDTYIVVAPVPGYAYFTATVATGATPTVLTGVPFPTYNTNFGDSTSSVANLGIESSFAGNCQFSAFRYASLAVGLYPTSNYMTFAGSTSVWKADVSLGGNSVVAQTATAVSTNVDTRRIFGLESVGPLIPRDNYTQSFIKGAFSVGFDMTGDFEWQPFVYQPSYYTTGVTTSPAYRSLQEMDGAHALPGFGNAETIIIKISTPTAAVNSAVLKFWNCLELKPRTDSNLYQFSHLSPELDEVALEAYSKVKTQLPVAVCAAENESAWKRVLDILAGLGGFVGRAPGPVGWIGSGVSSIARGISSLAF